MRIVADNKIPFLKGVLEPFAEMVYIPGKDIDPVIVKDADALLVRTRTQCDKLLLKGSKVRFIGSATIGYDHIDTNYCENNGIVWTNAPGCNSSSVKQYIMASLLKIASRDSFELKDKTIGIVGVGNVGKKIHQLALSMGMKVLLNDPPRKRNEGSMDFVPLEQLLTDSDIVTIHVPLTKDGIDNTQHLFKDETFSLMKKNSWLINSSRGEVVDNSSLKKMLLAHKLAGVVLDVWENEPDIDRELMKMTMISTPHIAGYSTDGKANGTAQIVNAVSSFFGIPLYRWYPSDLPAPPDNGIFFDCEGKTIQEVISGVVAHTYDISRDNLNLKESPQMFEKLRGDYPMRREFHYYKVKTKNGSFDIENSLKGMGFEVQNDNESF